MNILNEMARFGVALPCGKKKVDIELHGGNDRIYPPHIHMYHTEDRKTKDKPFTIEMNIANLMFEDTLVPCRIIDKKKSIDAMGKDAIKMISKYYAYYDTLEDFLKNGEVLAKYSDCIDNIAVAIRVFNEEADLNQLRKEHKELLKKKFGTIE